MHDLTRLTLALALLVPACGPGKDDSDSDASTSAGPTTADTTQDPSGTTADAPTTGDVPSTTSSATSSATSGGDGVACPGDALPPEGSPCAVEGEFCDPFADPCAPHAFAECSDGVWSHGEVGPGDPDECDPCNANPVDGQPCTDEGAFCGGGCEDQCQFCNVLMCSGGVWMNLEAPPAPCLECEQLCMFTVMPMCAEGPPDEAACVTGCMDVMAGPCNIEFSATRACAGFEPTFSCDAAERPTVAGCEDQFAALYACLGI